MTLEAEQVEPSRVVLERGWALTGRLAWKTADPTGFRQDLNVHWTVLRDCWLVGFGVYTDVAVNVDNTLNAHVRRWNGAAWGQSAPNLAIAAGGTFESLQWIPGMGMHINAGDWLTCRHRVTQGLLLNPITCENFTFFVELELDE